MHSDNKQMLANIQEEPPTERQVQGAEQNAKSPREKGKIHKQKMRRPPKHGMQGQQGMELGGFINVAGQKDPNQAQEPGPLKSKKTIKLSDLMPERQKHVADGNMSLFGVTSLEKPEEPSLVVAKRSAAQPPLPVTPTNQLTGSISTTCFNDCTAHRTIYYTIGWCFLGSFFEKYFFALFCTFLLAPKHFVCRQVLRKGLGNCKSVTGPNPGPPYSRPIVFWARSEI